MLALSSVSIQRVFNISSGTRKLILSVYSIWKSASVNQRHGNAFIPWFGFSSITDKPWYCWESQQSSRRFGIEAVISLNIDHLWMVCNGSVAHVWLPIHLLCWMNFIIVALWHKTTIYCSGIQLLCLCLIICKRISHFWSLSFILHELLKQNTLSNWNPQKPIYEPLKNPKLL